jgi:hypothetical protein
LVYTTYFPNSTIIPQNIQIAAVVPPAPQVQLSLWNLVRLACIMPAAEGFGGGSNVAMVKPTLLGRELINACTITRRSV